MCYFSFITISTVGYGDFSPRTVPGRFFIVFATVAGVSFFSVVSMQFVELQRIESSAFFVVLCSLYFFEQFAP